MYFLHLLELELRLLLPEPLLPELVLQHSAWHLNPLSPPNLWHLLSWKRVLRLLLELSRLVMMPLL